MAYADPLSRSSKKQEIERSRTMKKILPTIVAALVAISFAGLVFAQDAPAPAAPPAAPVAGEMKKVEKAPVRKHVKHKKHKRTMKARKVTKKEQTAPVETPAAK
jgi:hypothetical protein